MLNIRSCERLNKVIGPITSEREGYLRENHFHYIVVNRSDRFCFYYKFIITLADGHFECFVVSQRKNMLI